MSAGFEIWAREQPLHGWAHSRHVALERLGRGANHEGIAILTMAELALAIGKSLREARRLLAGLEASGKIKRVARFVPRQAANAYRLLAPWARREQAQEAPTAELVTAAAAPAEREPGAPQRRELTVPPWEWVPALDHHPNI